MLNSIRNRLVVIGAAILKPVNTTAILIMGVYTTLWGLWVLCPFWDVFTSAALYSALEALLPEPVWGLIAIACGLFIIRGALKPSYKALISGAAVGAWHWLLISVLYFMGDWSNTGGITALMLSAYCAYIYLNVRVNKLHGNSIED